MKLRLGILLLFVGLLGGGCVNKSDPAAQALLGLVTNTSSGSSNNSTPVNESFQLQVNDQTGNPDFIFNTTRTIPILVQIRDPFQSLSSSLVRVSNLNDSAQQVVFQASADPNGNVKGSFTINTADSWVLLQIILNGQTYTYKIDLSQVLEISRTLTINGNGTPVPIMDSDGDGVPDSLDYYPLDPTRAAMVRTPTSGYYTVAFEDLYPKEGDADFNDYVVRVYNEQDLNAQGDVVRVRGHYTHVAHGAAYVHTLHVIMNGVSGSYTYERDEPNGTPVEQNSGQIELNSSFQLMPNSSTTISSWNSRKTDTFEVGQSSHFEVILDQPASTLDLGSAPFDIYLHVINTDKDIHFSGRYFNADGSDKYLDKNGFPWALMMPGDWDWPYERQNIHQAYPEFKPWYTSEGKDYTDWYTKPQTGLVFPLPSQSN